MGLASRVRSRLRRERPGDAGLPDLGWVDEFIDRVRPYVFVREEDGLLIKRPNQAQKLNAAGVRVLGALLDGTSIDEILRSVGRDPGKVRDIDVFVRAVKRFLEGRLDETIPDAGVEVRPFDMRFSKLPVLSEVAVTYRCNLRCVFCYAGCNCTTNPVGDDREMSASEIREVLRKIWEEGRVPSVSFTGGEPTLRPELPALVLHAKKLGMWVNLITNGTRVTADLARALADAGLDSAQVSLEGVTARTHDAVTEIDGSLGRTLAGVEQLKRAGVASVHTNTTVNRLNLHECSRIPRFVKERLGNDKLSMNLLVPAGSAVTNGDLTVRYDEIGPCIREVLAESERAGVELMWYSALPMCIFNTVAHGLGNKGCSACDGLLSVGANGHVLPCSSWAESVGNLLEQDVRTVWGSRRARRYREKSLAHPGCRECEDFRICHGACPLYWREVGYGELERCRGFGPVGEEHFAS